MNLPLFRQALSLSSGTVSYLIDCTLYEIIDVVQREFAWFCLKHTEFDHWQPAWRAFAKQEEE